MEKRELYQTKENKVKLKLIHDAGWPGEDEMLPRPAERGEWCGRGIKKELISLYWCVCRR